MSANEKITAVLINKLKQFSNSDEYIDAILCYVETEEDRGKLVEYIDNGKDVSYSNIILYAIEIDENSNK